MNIRAKIFGGAEPPKSPFLQAKKPKGATAGHPAQRRRRSRESRAADNARSGDRHRLNGEQRTPPARRHGSSRSS